MKDRDVQQLRTDIADGGDRGREAQRQLLSEIRLVIVRAEMSDALREYALHVLTQFEKGNPEIQGKRRYPRGTSLTRARLVRADVTNLRESEVRPIGQFNMPLREAFERVAKNMGLAESTVEQMYYGTGPYSKREFKDVSYLSYDDWGLESAAEVAAFNELCNDLARACPASTIFATYASVTRSLS
jgi:hypothetical protein